MLAAVVLAIALAIDATVVTAALATAGARNVDLVRAALWFGVFQAGMAAVGAIGGATLEAWVAAWDHWVALILLTGVGGRMLWGTGDEDEEEAVAQGSPSTATMLTLAVATSIDALAAGVSVPMLEVPSWMTLVLIGTITAVLSGIGGVLGRAGGAAWGPWAERVGGVVLIGIGVRIVLQHTGVWP